MTVDKSARNRSQLAFGQNYSEYYDVLYSDKDYESECNYIETLFRQFSSGKVRRVLDIACGTGGHAIPLAKRGYTVFASDLSNGMLAQARKKARPKLDAQRNLCKVKYELTVDRKGSPEKKFYETHTMRYFFPEEMALLLESARFELKSLHPFLHSKARVKTSDWNISAVARAT